MQQTVIVRMPHIEYIDEKYSSLKHNSITWQHNQECSIKEVHQIDDIALGGRYEVKFTKGIVFPLEISFCGHPVTIL